MIYIKGGDDYPSYYFDEADPVSFGSVVAEHHGLPLSSRSLEEVEADIQTEFNCIISAKRSIIRREPKRYQSELFVTYLDEVDDTFQRIGRHAILSLRNFYTIQQAENTRPA